MSILSANYVKVTLLQQSLVIHVEFDGVPDLALEVLYHHLLVGATQVEVAHPWANCGTPHLSLSPTLRTASLCI